MKKSIKRIIFVLALCIFAVAVLSACGKYTLSRPGGVYVEQTTLTLRWNVITQADAYTVQITGDDGTKQEEAFDNEYALQYLAVGKYNIRVKAVDKDGEYKESSWSETVVFEREAETGLTYSLTKDKKSYVVTGMNKSLTEIVIPDTYRGKNVVAVKEGAFERKNSLISVKLGKNVTEIEARAFGACEALEEVILPDGLLKIGNNAFQSCKKLTEIVVPAGVETIPSDAFSYCSALTTVQFPQDLVTIKNNAFYRSGLTEISLPSGADTIEDNAFQDCSALTKANLGGTKTIGKEAFRNCPVLSTVRATKVKMVGAYAFQSCKALPSISLPAESIGDGAFLSCETLSEVSVGVGVTKIGSAAFYGTAVWNDSSDIVYIGDDDGRYVVGCKNTALSAVYANYSSERPNSVVWEPNVLGIADRAFMNYDPSTQLFYGHEKLNAIFLTDTVKWIGDRAFFGAKVLSSVTFGTGTEKIGKYAFASNTALRNILFPKYENGVSLREIDDYAFYNSLQFNSINSSKNGLFPDTLERIGMRAFNQTQFLNDGLKGDKLIYFGGWLVGYIGSLNEVIVAENTKGIIDYAFYKNDTVTNAYSLSAELKYVGRGAFSKCSALATADFTQSKSLKTVGAYAFYHCDKLTKVAFPYSLENMGEYVMSSCGVLNEVKFFEEIEDENGEIKKSTLSAIPVGSFSNCISLKSLVIPDSVQSIGNSAFSGCSGLETIILGDGVKTVGDRAFKNCVALSAVAFGKSLRTVGARAFYGCENLVTVDLPDSVRTIGDYSFYGCKGLENLKLNAGLRSVGKNAFAECKNLKSVVFPATLGQIGAHAFRSCNALSSVVIPNTVAEIGKHAFYGCNNITIYTDYSAAPDGFERLWNSSYRPVVWGCTLSDDKTYVVSVVRSEDDIQNVSEQKVLTAPEREGYDFLGWSLTPDGTEADYLLDFTTAPDGTVLYAIWAEAAE